MQLIRLTFLLAISCALNGHAFNATRHMTVLDQSKLVEIVVHHVWAVGQHLMSYEIRRSSGTHDWVSGDEKHIDSAYHRVVGIGYVTFARSPRRVQGPGRYFSAVYSIVAGFELLSAEFRAKRRNFINTFRWSVVGRGNRHRMLADYSRVYSREPSLTLWDAVV